MMSDIPEELVEEILCRVPATSLKRLRSTCKQWNRLFTDRKFSRKHFDKSPKQFPVVVMPQERTLCSLSLNLHNRIPSAEVTCELSLNQVVIHEVFHCDGLFLCTNMEDCRPIVVWNPCTGQIKKIKTPKSRCCQISSRFVLGNYQENKPCGGKNYKILRYTVCSCDHHKFDIYDISSNSWRNLDVVTPILDYMCSDSRVSLKGKTYWFVYPSSGSSNFPVGLISFDYTTERFERLRLPYQCNFSGNYSVSLSVAGEDKLSVLLQQIYSTRSEVYITNKIDDETKEMSWSKLLEVEVGIGRDIWPGRRFLVDEEKKIVVCCMRDHNKSEPDITVCIVGANSNATRGYFPLEAMPIVMPLVRPFLVDYVPSLIQIQ